MNDDCTAENILREIEAGCLHLPCLRQAVYNMDESRYGAVREARE